MTATDGATLSGVVAVAPQPSRPPSAEERLLINGVTWGTYVMLREALDDQRAGVRLTYLEGALEIMSPSDAHEAAKSLLGRLVEAYIDEQDLPIDGFGSTTFRHEAVARGLEPDESYTLGGRKPLPDLAIEVMFSAPKLDKLEVYRGLGVPEVWIWRDGQLVVHLLGTNGYKISSKSKLFPSLDVALLASFVRIDESQTALVKRFRAALRKPRAKRSRK